MSVRANHTRILSGFMIFTILVAMGPKTTALADGVIRGSVPLYTEAPVFYDFFWDYKANMENLELVHEGKVYLDKLGIESIEGFDWAERPGRSDSYWVMMENFRYLTPLIHSTAERDKAFVRKWLDGWLETHVGKRWKNYGAKDAMSAGFRVMTFVWYLKLLYERGETDSVWVARIHEAVKDHQEYLKYKFAVKSNHVYWEAMGLFETTRVYPDTAIVRLALRRLDQMITTSISERGFHMERSPFYHLEVWEWIKHYVEYFRALDGFEWSGFAKLEAAHRKMSRVNYYLCDHDGKVPQIGDTDVQHLDRKQPRSRRRPNIPEIFVDKRAGYAIYKDAEARHGRYVVFMVPNVETPNKMLYHNHDDLMSVYYSHRGEIIFGDQGRFSYVRDINRKYFMSARAHNTILPASQLERRNVQRMASSVLVKKDKDYNLFSASLEFDKVTRVVRLPRDRVEVEVLDTIIDNGPYVVLWHLGTDVESFRRIDNCETHGLTPDGRTMYRFELTTSRQRHFLLAISTDTGPPESKEAFEVISGLESPMFGWYSPGHEQKVPVPVIKFNLDVHGYANVATTIKPLGY